MNEEEPALEIGWVVVKIDPETKEPMDLFLSVEQSPGQVKWSRGSSALRLARKRDAVAIVEFLGVKEDVGFHERIWATGIHDNQTPDRAKWTLLQKKAK